VSIQRALGVSAALVPIKAFSEAKGRLSSTVNPADRSALARAMAAQVLFSAKPMATFVVCDSEEVGAWALSLGAEVLREPGRGLNGAVAAGIAQLQELGFERVVIAHSDLPLAIDLAWIADFSGVTIVPDRSARGTNVISIPLSHEHESQTEKSTFTFSYGPGSFGRHVREARRLGERVRVIPNYRLSADVDYPGDLRVATAAHAWPIIRAQ
jgi:2-phospho-L-lactate/phosphoenolpyruvate guanylyltransferase